MENKNKIELLSDQAITTIEEDKFGRKDFVNAVVDLIYSQSSKVNQDKNPDFKYVTENMTIGLFGPWGFGKSSVLNMLKSAVEHKGLLTVYFNPWMYKSEEQLILSLFNAISSKCGLNGEDKDKLIELFNKYYPLISLVSPVTGEMGKAMIKVFGKSDESSDASACKQAIDELLSQTANPLTIFIDDVDRLSKEEIHILFKTIRLIASFKHVIYVVACDFDMVAKSIKENYADGTYEDGRSFIDKIVQIPLRIPEITQEKLIQFAIEYINITCNIELLGNLIFSEIIRDYFHTPRDIKRFINAFRFTQNYMKDVVINSDLIIMELIRVKIPDLFEVIRVYYRAIKQPVNLFDGYFTSRAVDLLKCKRSELFDEAGKLIPNNLEFLRYNNIFKQLFNTEINRAIYTYQKQGRGYKDYINMEPVKQLKTFHNPRIVISYFERIDVSITL